MTPAALWLYLWFSFLPAENVRGLFPQKGRNWQKKKGGKGIEKMAGAVRPLVLPLLLEVGAETKSWTKRNNPWLLRAAVTRANANAKGILVCGNIGRR